MTLPEIIAYLNLSPDSLLKQCKTANYQASGPGGQKRNRKLSAVRLTHTGSGLAVTASEYREPKRNIARALHKLRLELALSIEKIDKLESPETFELPFFRGNANDEHPDFPGSALTAFYMFRFYEGVTGEAAKALNTGSAALIRFFKKDKNLWRCVQEVRKSFNHYPLK